MPGRIDLEFMLGTGTRREARPLGERMRILVLGNFTGRDHRGTADAADLGSRPIVRVDLDNFDTALRTLAPQLQLTGAAAAAPLAFESLDDFHPDRLCARLDAFRQLRESAAADQGPLLARLLGGPAPAAAAAPPKAGESVVDDLVRRLVQPHITPAPTPAAKAAAAALDASLGDLMRSVLHQPAFQRLESAWRGVRRFVEAVELGDEVELHLCDVSKAELHADMTAAAGDPTTSALCRRLSQSRVAGIERPWALLVCQFAFDANLDDLLLLQHLGAVASQAGGPILLDALPGLAGCAQLAEDTDPRDLACADADVEQGWHALRQGPAAAWIGLALPRVLLRLPYGKKTEAIDAFAFEEATDSHESLLWGSAALAAAQCIAQAFIEQADELSLDRAFDIDDLPGYVRERDGEKQLQPCAEFPLPVQVGDALLRRGFIPLLSYGNRAAVRIVGVQSIAEPTRGLAGFD